MGILSGIFKSRDKPQNATSGSAYRFFIGSSCLTKQNVPKRNIKSRKVSKSDTSCGGGNVVVTLDEMKKYLRVDFEDDDVLLSNIMESAQTLCMDVARITDEDAFEEEPCARIAVMYAVAYLYEHREEADHHALTLSLRSLLFGCRQEGF